MEHPETVRDDPDQGLLELLGLSRDQASNFLGRTMENRIRAYEVVDLRILTYLGGIPVNDEYAIIEWVRLRHGEQSATLVQDAFAFMSAPLQLETHEVLWVILPDIRHMIKIGKADSLRALLSLPGALSFMTPDPLAEEMLQEFLGTEAISARGETIYFRNAGTIGFQSTSLIGDPLMRDKAQLYYPMSEGWLNVQAPGASGYAVTLEERSVW